MSLLKSGKSLQALILLADSHVYKVATMNTLEEELHLHEKFVEVHKMLRFRDVLFTANYVNYQLILVTF